MGSIKREPLGSDDFENEACGGSLFCDQVLGFRRLLSCVV